MARLCLYAKARALCFASRWAPQYGDVLPYFDLMYQRPAGVHSEGMLLTSDDVRQWQLSTTVRKHLQSIGKRKASRSMSSTPSYAPYEQLARGYSVPMPEERDGAGSFSSALLSVVTVPVKDTYIKGDTTMSDGAHVVESTATPKHLVVRLNSTPAKAPRGIATPKHLVVRLNSTPAEAPRGIQITRWTGGRLGNHMIMLERAAEAAAFLGCDLSLPPKYELGNMMQQLIFDAPGGLGCEHQDEISSIYSNVSHFWWGGIKRHGPAYASLESKMRAHQTNSSQLFSFEPVSLESTLRAHQTNSSQRTKSILTGEHLDRARSILAGFLGHNETHANGLPCIKYHFDVALQLRAGDIFKGAFNANGSWVPAHVHTGYGQPPLSSYMQCLEDNLQPGQRAVAVCEDFTNPVAAALRTISLHSNRWNLTVVKLPLNETLATLGCAPVVCRAVSSLVYAYANQLRHPKIVAPDGAQILRTYDGPWKNTAQQRQAMLDRKM